MSGSGFHFRFPRAKVHRIGATRTWGITLSGTDAPRKTVYAQLHDAGTVAHEMIRLQREAAASKPVAKPEPVRDVKPRKGRTPTLATRPTHCPDCGRPVRLNTDKAADHPGTVCMFSSSTGLCGRCHRARQGVTQTQRPVRVTPVIRPADEPPTVPMTDTEVKAAMPAPRSPRPAPLRPVPAPVVTPVVREATAAYIPPATVAVGPHYLKPDADGDPFCACGWDPYPEVSDIDDRSALVTAVRLHLRKVRTTP